MRIIGTLRDLGDGRGVVRMEELYDTGIDDLWSALTVPSRLARWIAKLDGDPRLGATVYARFTSAWEGPCRVDVCDSPDHLLVTLKPDTPDETVVEARLAAAGARTRLVIEERGLPLGVLPYHGAGWQAHVEDLAAVVAERDAADWTARWTALTPIYQQMTVEPA